MLLADEIVLISFMVYFIAFRRMLLMVVKGGRSVRRPGDREAGDPRLMFLQLCIRHLHNIRPQPFELHQLLRVGNCQLLNIRQRVIGVFCLHHLLIEFLIAGRVALFVFFQFGKTRFDLFHRRQTR